FLRRGLLSLGLFGGSLRSDLGRGLFSRLGRGLSSRLGSGLVGRLALDRLGGLGSGSLLDHVNLPGSGLRRLGFGFGWFGVLFGFAFRGLVVMAAAGAVDMAFLAFEVGFELRASCRALRHVR